MSEGFPVGPTLLEPDREQPHIRSERLAKTILIPLAVLLGLVVLVFYVFFNRGRVDGPSMLPTLKNADMVLVTKSYPTPEHGDIIFTMVDEGGQQVELVKRVIAIPGDFVEIRDDTAIVNGIPEPERGQVVDPSQAVSIPQLQVPTGYVYVMGDNRPVSEDSRYIGPVPLSGVKGRVVAIYAPFTRIRVMSR